MLGRCVSADPAADLADLLAFGLRNVLAAALAAFLPVISVLFLCVNAEPAADFASLLASGFLKVLAAAVAAFLPVLSLFLLLMIIPIDWG